MLRYAITNRAQYPGDEVFRQESVVREAARWAAEGVEFIQIREKDLPAGKLAALTRQVLAAVREAGTGTRVLVNARLDVAVATGAEGVHLTGRGGELTPAQVREVYRSAGAGIGAGIGAGTGAGVPLISVSCHSVEEVRLAADRRVDAILFGPIFGKTVNGVEVAPALGVDVLRAACVASDGVAVFALGGVTKERLAECAQAGAVGVAGIRLFAGNLRSDS
jgi:thiamine-phosphate pyrophosphorylase